MSVFGNQIPRQTQEQAERSLLRRIPAHLMGLIRQYHAARDKAQEEEAQRAERERRKKAKEDADAVRASQQRETERKMRRKAR